MVEFCNKNNTTKEDILIVLGDSCLNYYEDERDTELKRKLSDINITFFCIHGNKKKRPQDISSYGIRNFCGGKVYYDPNFPNIFFAIDGNIYTFGKKKSIVIGGAHSVDKIDCLLINKPYWDKITS